MKARLLTRSSCGRIRNPDVADAVAPLLYNMAALVKPKRSFCFTMWSTHIFQALGAHGILAGLISMPNMVKVKVAYKVTSQGQCKLANWWRLWCVSCKEKNIHIGNNFKRWGVDSQFTLGSSTRKRESDWKFNMVIYYAINVCMYMYVWMDGWTDGRMDGWMDVVNPER